MWSSKIQKSSLNIKTYTEKSEFREKVRREIITSQEAGISMEDSCISQFLHFQPHIQSVYKFHPVFTHFLRSFSPSLSAVLHSILVFATDMLFVSSYPFHLIGLGGCSLTVPHLTLRGSFFILKHEKPTHVQSRSVGEVTATCGQFWPRKKRFGRWALFPFYPQMHLRRHSLFVHLSGIWHSNTEQCA